MKRILQIAPYPTTIPRHGGQIRARQTADILDAAGFQVLRMPIYRRSHYPAPGCRPAVDIDRATWIPPYHDVWQVADFADGLAVANDGACFAAFARLAAEAAPDLVLLEEPWLWPAVKEWRKTAASPCPVVYSAYNVESEAKGRILTDAGVAETHAIVARIEELEREVVGAAAGVVVVAEADAERYRAWTGHPVVVAVNGTAPRRRDHLSGILPEQLQPRWRYALFVGSAHPPNARGFSDLVMAGLSSLRTDERVVVAGGASHLIAQGLPQDGLPNFFRDRLVLLGEVGSFALDCLIHNATATLLPITYGGGSNLKTAEALLAGHPIVATRMAFRGFEAFAEMPGVTFAENAATFAQAMRDVLDGKVGSVPAQDRLRALLWERTLQPVVELVREVLR